MAAVETAEYLRQVPLFSRLSAASLERVAAIAHQVVFPRRSHLTTAGQPGRAFFYILSGEAVVRAAGPHGHLRPVSYFRPGDYFGVTSLLLGEPHDATVQAVTDVVALVLEREAFAHLRQQDPKLEAELVLPEPIQLKLQHENLPWLSPGEVVVFLARRHWIVFAKSLVLPTLLVAVFGAAVFGLLWLFQLPLSAAYIASIILYLVALGWFLVDWRNDYYAVTTQRLVRRELVVGLYEYRQEAPLGSVQDVNIVRTLLGNIFRYGDAIIETAGHQGKDKLVFDHLHSPEAAKEAIFQQLYRARAQTQYAAGESVRRELKRRLGWVTPEELEAEGLARPTSGAKQQVKPASGWLARLPHPRLIAPLREQEGETITWRKHWIFLLSRWCKPLVPFLLWLIFLTTYLRLAPAFTAVSPSGAALGFGVALFFIGFWFWWEYANWENDIYRVTEDRLVDIEQTPLGGKEERRETSLDRVQNVNLVVPNIVATVLNYGDVDIDTAGGEGKFTFTHVVAPHEVQRDVMNHVARLRERQRQMESQQRRKEIANWFAVYEDLRERREGTAPGPTSPDASENET